MWSCSSFIIMQQLRKRRLPINYIILITWWNCCYQSMCMFCSCWTIVNQCVVMRIGCWLFIFSLYICFVLFGHCELICCYANWLCELCMPKKTKSVVSRPKKKRSVMPKEDRKRECSAEGKETSGFYNLSLLLNFVFRWFLFTSRKVCQSNAKGNNS